MAACLNAQASQNEIRIALESNDEDAKVEAMQKAITAILAGEQFPALFITIVRYVLPSENHMVQKLLLLYLVSPLPCWEGCGGLQGMVNLGAGLMEVQTLHAWLTFVRRFSCAPKHRSPLPRCRRPSRRPMPRASCCRRW